MEESLSITSEMYARTITLSRDHVKAAVKTAQLAIVKYHICTCTENMAGKLQIENRAKLVSNWQQRRSDTLAD